MQRTGEAYTTSRIHLLKITSRSSKTAPADPDYAKLSGTSDASIEAATGRSWKRWVATLDRAKAHEWPHQKIAEYVQEEYEVEDWWAQAVTVGYERIRGLREIGQRRGGSYEATKSRTFPVPVAVLFQAFAEGRTRARWLPGRDFTVRKSTPHRSVRIAWGDGTSVEVWLVAKGESKSTVQIQHRKVATKEAASRLKDFWTERLDALGQLLRSRS